MHVRIVDHAHEHFVRPRPFFLAKKIGGKRGLTMSVEPCCVRARLEALLKALPKDLLKALVKALLQVHLAVRARYECVACSGACSVADLLQL